MKEIVNRKAKYEYHFLSGFDAGVVLVGTEVKSIKASDANLKDAYCLFKDDELFIKSMFIGEYHFGNINNHETRRDRKLLLKKVELKKIQKKVKEKGYSIIPYRIFMNERNIIKIEIYLVQGKKAHDKRHAIKDRDNKREMDRIKSEH